MSAARAGFVVFAGDLPPYHFEDANKRIVGISVEVLTEMMRRCDMAFHPELVRNPPWARALKETELIPDHLLIGVVRTADREPLFKWIGPLSTIRMGLIAKKSRHIRIRDKDEIRNYSIGAINNSAPASLLQAEGFPKEKLTLLTDNNQQFRMLQAERVDLITHVDTVAPYFMRELGYALEEYEMIHVIREVPLYFAVNKATDDAVVARLQHALDEMKKKPAKGQSSYDAIVQSYLGEEALHVVLP
ncbi:transporter substrate-binding domain-containing protein [Desulfovibrio mangrovi]|uniref:substrate-binding periplasmic protein n=1 Tax=Desulfovibrio mangrovi TaxID=2976983 RepID=UPI00224547DE|nr:transporter substrate-binding domain-containing protein [Desulfovibrio mangrovi]UZP65819.1 transporter substrate-binding domain-containing protein [Desulfovibrio mangrovi]